MKSQERYVVSYWRRNWKDIVILHLPYILLGITFCDWALETGLRKNERWWTRDHIIEFFSKKKDIVDPTYVLKGSSSIEYPFSQSTPYTLELLAPLNREISELQTDTGRLRNRINHLVTDSAYSSKLIKHSEKINDSLATQLAVAKNTPPPQPIVRTVIKWLPPKVVPPKKQVQTLAVNKPLKQKTNFVPIKKYAPLNTDSISKVYEQRIKTISASMQKYSKKSLK